MSEVVMVVGYPAAGKSTVVKPLVDAGYLLFNRDTMSGNKSLDRLAGLFFEAVLEAKGETKSYVLDNTFGSAESRRPFIDAAQKAGLPVRCIHLNTSLGQAQFNAARRMVQRYGKLLSAKEIKTHPEAKSDPNMFPPAAQYAYRKRFEEPTMAEGFESIEVQEFEPSFGPEYVGKAVFLDYDGTLRDVPEGSEYPYPTDPSQVIILPGRRDKLLTLQRQGYTLVGVSNQSGITKGTVTEERARECFEHTNKLLGVDIDFMFCPHRAGVPQCYCRKPLPGLGAVFVERYRLNPSDCLMVGDLKSDAGFAESCGFGYQHPDQFFG